MSWLYARSRTWRTIVDVTRHSSLHMAGFAVLVLGTSAFLGQGAMNKTNSPQVDSALEQRLRDKTSLETQMLVKAQKKRLQLLFDEIQQGRGAERYEAALE